VLAVNVDYKKGIAIIGTEPNRDVPHEKILNSLKAIGYHGKFVD